MNNITFYIVDNNEKVIKVTIRDNKTMIDHYKDSVIYPFYHKDMVSLNEVTAFLESRCFDKNRPDRNDLLSHLGLDNYNVWDIVRKTNGKMAHDHLAVEFI